MTTDNENLRMKSLPPRIKSKCRHLDLAAFLRATTLGKSLCCLGKANRGYAKFQGKLGESAERRRLSQVRRGFERAGERLGVYAHLKTAEDTADSCYQRMYGRYMNVAARRRGRVLYPPGIARDSAPDETVFSADVLSIIGFCWNGSCVQAAHAR